MHQYPTAFDTALKVTIMFDSETQKEILDSITNSGSIEHNEIKVNTNISDVLSFSSGSARLQSSAIRKARLILGKPHELVSLDNKQIKCVLCKRVISYPCWYYNIRYAVNHFHYFICFDKDSASKPTAKCYKKD